MTCISKQLNLQKNVLTMIASAQKEVRKAEELQIKFESGDAAGYRRPANGL